MQELRNTARLLDSETVSTARLARRESSEPATLIWYIGVRESLRHSRVQLMLQSY